MKAIKTFFPNGVIKEVFTIDDKGLKQGLYQLYYESGGKLEGEEFYINGERHGICKYYNPNGRLKKELYFKLGKLHGICKTYFDNGELENESIYENGIFKDMLL